MAALLGNIFSGKKSSVKGARRSVSTNKEKIEDVEKDNRKERAAGS